MMHWKTQFFCLFVFLVRAQGLYSSFFCATRSFLPLSSSGNHVWRMRWGVFVHSIGRGVFLSMTGYRRYLSQLLSHCYQSKTPIKVWIEYGHFLLTFPWNENNLNFIHLASDTHTRTFWHHQHAWAKVFIDQLICKTDASAPSDVYMTLFVICLCICNMPLVFFLTFSHTHTRSLYTPVSSRTSAVLVFTLLSMELMINVWFHGLSSSTEPLWRTLCGLKSRKQNNRM